MGYPTASTIWGLSQPSTEIRQLIDRLFILADSKTEDAGERLAREVFTPDGEFMLAHKTFVGATEIGESRRDAWTTVRFRRHVVSKVYVNDAHGTDMIIIGRLSTENWEGKEVSVDFVARMAVQMGDHDARVQQYRLISPAAQDPRPLLNDEQNIDVNS